MIQYEFADTLCIGVIVVHSIPNANIPVRSSCNHMPANVNDWTDYWQEANKSRAFFNNFLSVFLLSVLSIATMWLAIRVCISQAWSFVWHFKIYNFLRTHWSHKIRNRNYFTNSNLARIWFDWVALQDRKKITIRNTMIVNYLMVDSRQICVFCSCFFPVLSCRFQQMSLHTQCNETEIKCRTSPIGDLLIIWICFSIWNAH